jgi:hypothetical protein
VVGCKHSNGSVVAGIGKMIVAQDVVGPDEKVGRAVEWLMTGVQGVYDMEAQETGQCLRERAGRAVERDDEGGSDHSLSVRSDDEEDARLGRL